MNRTDTKKNEQIHSLILLYLFVLHTKFKTKFKVKYVDGESELCWFFLLLRKQKNCGQSVWQNAYPKNLKQTNKYIRKEV